MYVCFKYEEVLDLTNPVTTLGAGACSFGTVVLSNTVFMEWNIRESEQGSVAMWDTIFRVGGVAGTELSTKNCHQFGNQAHEKYYWSNSMSGDNYRRFWRI